MELDTCSLGDDLDITGVAPRDLANGTWVSGTVAGHDFEALVFPGHADNPDYELGDSRSVPGDSRISKLWVRRAKDRRVVFNWDRGPDIAAKDAAAARVVDFLTAGLAEHVFGV